MRRILIAALPLVLAACSTLDVSNGAAQVAHSQCMAEANTPAAVERCDGVGRGADWD